VLEVLVVAVVVDLVLGAALEQMELQTLVAVEAVALVEMETAELADLELLF
jgi:hypothetical protein